LKINNTGLDFDDFAIEIIGEEFLKLMDPFVKRMKTPPTAMGVGATLKAVIEKQKKTPFDFGMNLVDWYDEAEFELFQPFLGFCQLALVQNATLERVFAMCCSLYSSSQMCQSCERMTAAVRLRIDGLHLNAAKRQSHCQYQPTGIVPKFQCLTEKSWGEKDQDINQSNNEMEL